MAYPIRWALISCSWGWIQFKYCTETKYQIENYLLLLYGKFLPKLSVIFSIITLEGLSQSAELL